MLDVIEGAWHTHQDMCLAYRWHSVSAGGGAGNAGSGLCSRTARGRACWLLSSAPLTQFAWDLFPLAALLSPRVRDQT